ncbi:MAG: BatA domain-containing protein, partial [Myxococcota bacterium]
MNVLNPLFLIGLLAAALPIIIHLINRRRAVRRKFPAIEFLLRSQKRLARRLKIRQLILLALRVSALLLIPLAMARPYIISDTGTTDADRMPTAIVFVVDDSAS